MKPIYLFSIIISFVFSFCYTKYLNLVKDNNKNAIIFFSQQKLANLNLELVKITNKTFRKEDKMTKLKLLDYAGKENIITLEKEIQAIFYQMLSGDDVVYILYKDGTKDYFGSSATRTVDFFDGGDFIPLDKIKENKIFNVREWFKNSLEED